MFDRALALEVGDPMHVVAGIVGALFFGYVALRAGPLARRTMEIQGRIWGFRSTPARNRSSKWLYGTIGVVGVAGSVGSSSPTRP